MPTLKGFVKGKRKGVTEKEDVQDKKTGKEKEIYRLRERKRLILSHTVWRTLNPRQAKCERQSQIERQSNRMNVNEKYNNNYRQTN